jgi:hypothetical protein
VSISSVCNLVNAGRHLLPSTMIEVAWVGTSIAVVSGLYSNTMLSLSIASVSCLGYLKYKEYQWSVFSGFRKYSYIDGSNYEGDIVNGKWHGKGKLISSKGHIYEGDFFNGNPQGKGKLTWSSGNVYEGDFFGGKPQGKGKQTQSDGIVHEGEFFDGKPRGKGKQIQPDGTVYEGEFFNSQLINSDISNLGDKVFFHFVCRLSRKGAPSGYSLGITSDYLQKKGYKTLGSALGSAHRLLGIDPEKNEKESERIHNILNQGSSQLFQYGYREHSMGLNLVPDLFKGFVLCEIFNSGEGLKKYHQKHETDFRKYKTMLQIRVPISSLTPDTIRFFLSSQNLENIDDVYRVILDLPGAENIQSDLIPWQTAQKDSECNFRWILVYLKNKMPEEEYKKMLSELRLDCEAAYRSKNPHEDLRLDQSWRKDKRTFLNGISYEGDFVCGTFHGWGKLTKSNGDVYEGEFFDGKPHGQGKLTLSNWGVYEGQFAHGKMNGQGKQILVNGDVYEGGFMDNEPHGQGKWTWIDGRFCEGEFSHGKMHGQGTYTFANGDIYKGAFIDGKFHGYGEKICADGSFLKGEFFKDQLINNLNVFQLVDRLFFKVLHR